MIIRLAKCATHVAAPYMEMVLLQCHCYMSSMEHGDLSMSIDVVHSYLYPLQITVS